MADLRGETAFVACGHQVIWLRRCAALRRLVTSIGDQDLVEHLFLPKIRAGRPASL